MHAPANGAFIGNQLSKASTWVLVAGTVITGLVFRWAWKDAVDNDAKRFQAGVEQYRQEFETRAEKYEQGLEIMADWIGSNETPTLTQWENRMERTNLPSDYPGMTELAFAPVFHAASRNRELWQNSHPGHWPPPSEWEDWGFQVWYQTTQGPAAPPKWGRKLAGLFDFFGGVTNLNFFYTKGVRSTKRVMMPAQGSNQQLASFIFVVAALRNDLPRSTKLGETYGPNEDLGNYPPERGIQRRMGTIGLLAGTVCMEPFLESIFGSRKLEIDVDIYAGSVDETNRMTHLDRPHLTQGGSPYYVDLELPWYRDRWHIVYSTRP